MRGALLSLNKACLSPRRMRRPALLPSTGHGGWSWMSSVCLQPCPRARGAAWRLRGVDLRLSLLLAGRGGEGQRAVGRGPVMGVNWRGSFAVSAFGRDADRLPSLLNGLLPWRKPPELLLKVLPLSNKRHHLLGGGTALVLFFSAGRGGEGEGSDSGAATMLPKWLIPDGAGGSDLLNCRLPELCFHPLVFAAPGLECLRYYHMRCVSLWMVEYQFCSHKANQISGQQRSWSCLCACKSIRRGKDHQRHARTRCLLGFKEMVVLHLQSGCCIWISCQAAVHAVFAFFVPLGCIRRRQMRESPMSLPRFSGEEFSDLSSVMHPQDLQLNLKPHRRPPTRLLVEPLALRLVRLQEAPGEDNCRFLVRILIEPPDRLHLCSPASTALSIASFLQCVHLGTWFISVFQSLSCLVYVVSVCYF